MMNKEKYLKKKTIIELKVLAKKHNITGYSNMNKEQLVKLLTSRIRLFTLLDYKWVIVVFIAIVALIAPMKTCNYNKASSEISRSNSCNKYSQHKFKNAETFNINILDFNSYNTCNKESDCENELAVQIAKLEDKLNITFKINIENCSSKNLNLFTESQVEKYAELTNSDLVIYGSEEKIKDSIQVRLSYVINKELRNEWNVANKRNFKFSDISNFDLYNYEGEFLNLIDIIIWNVGQKVIYQDTLNNGQVLRSILSNISEENYELKSMSTVLEGISYTKELKVDSAILSYNKAISYDSINEMAHFHNGAIHLTSFEAEEALEDIYIAKMIQFQKRESTKIDELPPKNNKTISTTEWIEVTLKTMDLPLAFSFLLDATYRPDLGCKFVKYYYNYVFSIIEYEDLDWYQRIDDYEIFLSKCDN